MLLSELWQYMVGSISMAMKNVFNFFDLWHQTSLALELKKNISIKQQKCFLKCICIPNNCPFFYIRILTVANLFGSSSWRTCKFSLAPVSKLRMIPHFEAISIKIHAVVEKSRQIQRTFLYSLSLLLLIFSSSFYPFFPQDLRIFFYETPLLLKDKVHH